MENLFANNKDQMGGAADLPERAGVYLWEKYIILKKQEFL